MANMSDLDTTGIGIIAFWNALDHRVVPGVGDVDPTDCIAIFSSYDVYDNGIEGYKALGSGRYFHARVKSDGWMVAWIDRTNTFAYPNKAAADFGEDAHKGYYDILWNWFSGTQISNTETTLSYLVSQLYDQLSNKDSFTFSALDVGHYSYEYSSASVLTAISLGCGHASKTGNVQYTSGTTLYYAAVTGKGYGGGCETPNAQVSFKGHSLVSHGVLFATYYGVADLLAEGWMPNPLVPCGLYVLGAFCGPEILGAILVLWS